MNKSDAKVILEMLDTWGSKDLDQVGTIQRDGLKILVEEGCCLYVINFMD